MRLYYQHVGEAMAARDFPKSLGDASGGLKKFSIPEIAAKSSDILKADMEYLESVLHADGLVGCQIWGVPLGAQRVVQNMGRGDYIMLMEAKQFSYVGRVLFKFSRMQHGFSKALWGEDRFPICIALDGAFCFYEFEEFKKDFSLDDKYHMRGNTMVLGRERIKASKFRDARSYAQHVVGHQRIV